MSLQYLWHFKITYLWFFFQTKILEKYFLVYFVLTWAWAGEAFLILKVAGRFPCHKYLGGKREFRFYEMISHSGGESLWVFDASLMFRVETSLWEQGQILRKEITAHCCVHTAHRKRMEPVQAQSSCWLYVNHSCCRHVVPRK